MTHWAFDTEDDSKGNVKLINFYNGKKHYWFKDQEKAKRFVMEKVHGNVWAVNLAYDLWNTFNLDIRNLKQVYIGSRLIKASIGSIFFKDVLNHWKISVKEMGKRIGLEKLEDDLFDKKSKVTFRKLLIRCKRDTEITWHFVNEMKKHYAEFDAQLKSTIGATAYDLFERVYWRKKIKTNPFKTKDLDFMRKGYYGGRTEIFFNKPITGDIYYYDFNSLYPSVMGDNVFVDIYDKATKITRRKSIRTIKNFEGITNATVVCPIGLKIPYLPYREPKTGRLIFPTGRFRGHWTNFELREAEKIGYKIEKIHETISFKGNKLFIFRSFTKNLYEKRLEAKNKKDEFLSDCLKNVMNNLYGKFGQGKEFTEIVPLTNKKQLNHGDLIVNGSIIKSVESDEYPRQTNFLWPAYVTAFGRHKVYGALREIESYEGSVLAYCDTDSVIFKSDKRIFKDSKELGELKLEGEFEEAYFKLPKLYYLKEKSGVKKYRTKGVPKVKAEEFFIHGKVSFDRPNKFRETMRRLNSKSKNKLICNEWVQTQKELRAKYDKRIVLKNGETRPIQIKN